MPARDRIDVALCVLVQRRQWVQIASLKVECLRTDLPNVVDEPIGTAADGEFDVGP